MADAGDLAGIVAGYKAGTFTYEQARNLLREYGTGDNTIDTLLAGAASIVVGSVIGSMVNDVVDGIFGDLF